MEWIFVIKLVLCILVAFGGGVGSSDDIKRDKNSDNL